MTTNVSNRRCARETARGDLKLRAHARAALLLFGAVLFIEAQAAPVNPPMAYNEFSPSFISVGGSSLLTITLTNDNDDAIVGVGFVDNYPAPINVVNSGADPVVANTCNALVDAPPNATYVVASSGTILPHQSCAISIAVVASSPGSSVNSTGPISSANAPTGSPHTATLTMTNSPLLPAPAVSTTFVPSTAVNGGSSTIVVHLDNPSSDPITGVRFSNAYQSGIVNTTNGPVVSDDTCLGTMAADPGASGFSLVNGVVPAQSGCDVIVNVLATTPGVDVTSSTTAVASGNAFTSNPSAGTLSIAAGPPLFEPIANVEFLPPDISVGGTSQLHIALTNANAATITGLGLSAKLIAPLHATTASDGVIVDNTCGGSLIADPNGDSLSLVGGQIDPDTDCDIRINVTGVSAGTVDLQTSAIASSNARSGESASATLTVDSTPLLSGPLVTKTFTPASTAVGGTSQMEVRLINPNIAATITGLQFHDVYPPGMENAAQDVVVSNTCGGTVIATPGGHSLELVGGNVQVVPSACIVRINVVGTLSGAHIDNHTGSVPSANAFPGNEAVGTLDVSSDPLMPAPVIAMDFGPSSIVVGGASTLTVTLTNPNSAPVLGAQFKNEFPAGLAENDWVANTCGGTIDEDVDFFSLLNGTIPANGSCSIMVRTLATAPGTIVDTTTSLASSNAQTSPGATSTLDVANGSLLPAPIITKAFMPATVSAGGESQMVISIANNNAFFTLTGAEVFDSYPAGMRNAPQNAIAGNSCGGTVVAAPNGTTMVLDNGTIPPNQQCSVRINVVGTTPNTVVDNHTGPVFSGNAVTANDASADLTVSGTPLLPAPTIDMTFSPTNIVAGGTSQMTITLANPNATPIIGAAFTDVYPAGMTESGLYGVIDNTCGGFLDESPDSVALANVSLAANGTCKLVVQVTGNAIGPFINTTSVLSSANAAIANGATATLTVDPGALLPAPVAAKSFAPSAVSVGGTSQMTIAFTNVDPARAVSGLQVWDPYPGHLANASGNALVSNTCAGTVTATPGDTQMILGGGSIAPGGSCAIIVNVTGTSAGSVDNHVTATSGNAPASPDASAQLTVAGTPLLTAPTVAKSFNPATVPVGTVSQMTIALGNSNATAILGAQFVDAYPQGLANASSGVVASNTCGGTVTAAPNATSAALANGSIPPGGCSVVLRVVGTSIGGAVNHTGSVHTSNATSGFDASATLTVTAASGNQSPVAVGEAVEVAPGGTTSEIVGDPVAPNSVLHNDVDADAGDTLTATKLTDPAHGTLQFNADGTFVYHNTGSAPSDSFTYRACDNHNACSPAATVSIAIGNNLNDHAPFATGDAIAVAPGATTSMLIGDPNAIDSVLDNDVDIDPNDVLDAQLLVSPQHGTLLAFTPAGTLSYRNDDPLATTDSFSYEACDIEGACSLGIVTITIGQNIDDQLPVVIDDAIQVAPNGSTSAILGDAQAIDSVLDNDSDPDPTDTLHTSGVCNLVNGSGSLTLQADGTFVYQNTAPVVSDLCFHETCDQLGACVSSRLTVTIDGGAPDQAPVAVDDALEVAPNGESSSLIGDANVPASVLDNDSDADDAHATLTAQLIAPPVSGTVSINVDGTFTYQNTDPAATVDAFQYEVCDPSFACTGATVAVTINHEAPTITCRLPAQVAMVGSAVSIDLATLFAPPPGATLVFDATNLPPSLSLVGALLSGTLQPGDVAGSPFASTLRATAGTASASEDVVFQVLPSGEILFRNGYDLEDPNTLCE